MWPSQVPGHALWTDKSFPTTSHVGPGMQEPYNGQILIWGHFRIALEDSECAINVCSAWARTMCGQRWRTICVYYRRGMHVLGATDTRATLFKQVIERPERSNIHRECGACEWCLTVSSRAAYRCRAYVTPPVDGAYLRWIRRLANVTVLSHFAPLKKEDSAQKWHTNWCR